MFQSHDLQRVSDCENSFVIEEVAIILYNLMNSGQQHRHVLYQLSKNGIPLLAVSVVAPSL